MGMFDDNGPGMNMWVNMSLFKIPSTRAPNELMEDMGPAFAVLAVGGLACLGGYAIYNSVAGEAEAPRLEHLSTEHGAFLQRFEDYQRAPKSEFVEQYRGLAEAYNFAGVLLGTSAALDQPDAGHLEGLQSKAAEISRSGLAALRELDGKNGVMAAHEGGLSVAWSAMGNLENLAKAGPLDEAQTFELESMRGVLKDILFSMSE